MSVQVTYENTPNPNSLKFIINKKICDETIEFKSTNESKRSPLAQKILGFPWAKRIFLGENFVTVTKEEWLEWEMISAPLSDLIKTHFDEGGKALLPKVSKETLKKQTEESEDVKKIKEILDNDIQPAVAMDGGYINFVSYEKGIVSLSLQGACSGCPSASLTLKQGIENRLKQSVPSVKEVLEV